MIRVKKIIRILSSHEYKDTPDGTKVYQYADGSFLPDEQQPKPLNNLVYRPHNSTRYKNVTLGENGIPLAFNPQTGKVKESDKPLPELYSFREECCGCTACYAICPVIQFLPNEGKEIVGNFIEIYNLPHGAIYMEEDEEGFLYPVLDASLCIRCNMCIKVCPFKNAK